MKNLTSICSLVCFYSHMDFGAHEEAPSMLSATKTGTNQELRTHKYNK